MIDGPALSIVTVNTLHTNGTCTVTTVGGGVIKAVGHTVAAGKKAYLKGGAIVGEAPNVSHYEIQV